MKAGDLVRVDMGKSVGRKLAIHGRLGVILYATEKPTGRGVVTCIVQLFGSNHTHLLAAESLSVVAEAQHD